MKLLVIVCLNCVINNEVNYAAIFYMTHFWYDKFHIPIYFDKKFQSSISLYDENLEVWKYIIGHALQNI